MSDPTFPLSHATETRQALVDILRGYMSVDVLELVNPALGAVDDLKNATATVVAGATWTAAMLKTAGRTKLAAAGVTGKSTARVLSFTKGGAQPTHCYDSAAVVGKDIDGAELTETVALNAAGGAGTVYSVGCYSDVVTITLSGASNTDATLALGIGDTFGMPSKLALRDGLPHIVEEGIDGVRIGAATASATTGISYASATTGISYASAVTGATIGDMPRPVMFPPTSLPTGSGVTLHAQDAGGAPLALVAGFTNPLPARGMNIARSNAGPASVDYTLTGTGPDGVTAVSEVLAVPKGGNANSVNAATWTGVSTTVDPVSTSDFTCSDGFCAGMIFKTGTTPILACDSVRETVVSCVPANGTIYPTTAPNGVHSYSVEAQWTAALTDGGHTHAKTDTGHTHAKTDGGHTHSSSAGTFVAAATSTPYGSYTPSTAPDGAHDYYVVFEQDMS